MILLVFQPLLSLHVLQLLTAQLQLLCLCLVDNWVVFVDFLLAFYLKNQVHFMVSTVVLAPSNFTILGALEAITPSYIYIY